MFDLSNETSVLIVIIALVLLMAAEVPVAFALLAAGASGILMIDGWNSATAALGRMPFEIPARYVLVVIPMFIAMGVFAKEGRIASDLFDMAYCALKRFREGIPIATIATCAVFAAISGSSVATVAALGPTCVEEMRKRGFSDAFAAGVVGAAGTLGVLIPPSVILVVYGLITTESIGQLMIAGILPGILTALAYAVAVAVLVRIVPGGKQPEGETSSNFSMSGGSTARKSYALFRVIVLFGVVIGGIYTGTATVTEASALGAALAFVFFLGDLLRRPEGRTKALFKALNESVGVTGMVFALLIGASIFTYFLVLSRVPESFTEYVLSFDLPPILVVALLLLAFVPLGMFLDGLSMMLIAVPLAYPVVTELGFSGIWFGILVVKAVEIGLVTPPFGLNAFVVSGAVPGLRVETAFKGLLLFVPVDLFVIAALFIFPEIVLWLPSQMG
ncbi:MAG: TRAP transporter large permease [Silicimonas sp.]